MPEAVAMERENASSIKRLGIAPLCVILYAALVSCYSPNQQKFDKELRALVYPGMAVSTAVDRLSSRGFTCWGDRPLTCDRIRQRYSLRSREEIYSKLDLFYRAHWYTRDCQLTGRSSSPFNLGVVQLRRQLLEWVADNESDWDHVELST